MLKISIHQKLAAGVLCIPLLLVGCGSSDDPKEDVVKIGVFLDSPVKGLSYVTTPSGKMGVTNEKGEYEYEEGDTVEFLIGVVSIGEVEAAPEVPVTSLPKSLSVARVLQTLDTESEDDSIIDISSIVIPDEIEDELEVFLSAESEGDIAEVLTDENLQVVEDASIEASGDEDLDIADTAVSAAEAVEHISLTLEETFTNTDLAKQVFTMSFVDEGTTKTRTWYFLEGGSVYIYKHAQGDENASSAQADWEIVDGKLVVGGEETYTLHSVTDNSYATTAFKAGEEDDVRSFVFEKTLPFSLADSSGQILKALDEDPECSDRTIELSADGTVGTVKSLCGAAGGYHESTVTYAESAVLDNVIEQTGEDGDGTFTVLLTLIDGDVTELGSVVKVGLTTALDSDGVDASVKSYEIVSEPVQEPVVSGGFTTSDISGEVFTRTAGEDDDIAVIMTFYTDGTGTEFNGGEDSSRGGVYSDEFTWSVIDGFLEIEYSNDSSVVKVALNSVSGTSHSVTVIEEDEEFGAVIYKALPTALDDFAGKILSLSNPAEDANCEQRTIKFSDDGKTADVKEICGGNFFESNGLSTDEHDDLSHSVLLEQPVTGGGSYLMLVEGDLSTDAPVTLAVISDKGGDDGIEAVALETYELVDEELTAPPIGPSFAISDFAKQAYVGVEDGMVLTFENGGKGVEFNDGDGSTNGSPYAHAFNWSITSDGKLFADYTPSEGGNVTVTLLESNANAYSINVLESDGRNDDALLYKALPLTTADLNGKIISLDMSDDSSCTAMTFAFTGSNVSQTEICSDVTNGANTEQYTIADSNGFDNIVVMENTDAEGDELSMLLVEGSLESDQGTVVFVVKRDGEIRDVVVHDFDLVDEEASVPALEFKASDFANQAYIGPAGEMVLFFNDDGTGEEFDYDSSDDSKSEAFGWSINSEGELFLDYASDDYNDVTVALLESTGNKYTIFADGESQDLYKALPLSLSDLDGKILSLDTEQSSGDCSAITWKVTGTIIRNSSLCDSDEDDDGIHVGEMTLSNHPSQDNVLVTTDEGDGDKNYLFLVNGSVETGGSLAIVGVPGEDGEITFVRSGLSFELTDTEAVPVGTETETGESSLASLIVGNTFYDYDKDSPSDIVSITFETDGSFVVKSLTDPNEEDYVASYTVDGDSFFLFEDESVAESTITLIEVTSTYIKFSEEGEEDATLYLSESFIPVNE